MLKPQESLEDARHGLGLAFDVDLVLLICPLPPHFDQQSLWIPCQDFDGSSVIIILSLRIGIWR